VTAGWAKSHLPRPVCLSRMFSTATRPSSHHTRTKTTLLDDRELPPDTMLDGELVVVRDSGPDFHALMARHARRPGRRPYLSEPVRYVVFDLLYLAGERLTHQPLSRRRELLHAILPASPHLAYCAGIAGHGKAFFESTIAAGHEGVVAKRLTSRYTPNQRGTAWRKMKQTMELVCVVVGYRTGPRGLRDLQMAAVIGGKLAYVGTVELGVEQKIVAQLRGRRRAVVACPTGTRPVEPDLLCAVRSCGWRPGGWWRDAVLARWLRGPGQAGAWSMNEHGVEVSL
jgi:bifunctional non-homologous end joining protein LigD